MSPLATAQDETEHMKEFIKENFLNSKFILGTILVMVCAGVIARNYTPGTFLTGWDTLHPEFNFSLAFSRAINGVWRSDQGLGTIAIQSHMADLLRIFILWILSFVFSTNSLRYITMLAPIIIGPLGVYFLGGFLFSEKKFVRYGAFLGALAYLCNLVVVQQFVVPLEMFAFHYAFLPWSLLLALRFITYGKVKNFLFFCLTAILLIPQAHTATLFYTYFLGISITLITFFVIHKNRSILNRILLILVSILVINSYWMLPNIYAIIFQGKEVRQSQINRFFSNEAFAKNQVFGNPSDTAIGKSFLFDWQLYNAKKEAGEDVLDPWIKHLKNPLVLVFGYFVFFTSLAGLIYAVVKKDKKVLVFAPITMLSYGIILNGTWPINLIFENISKFSPTIKEALRFPFTKFSIFYIFGLSIFFMEGVIFFLSRLKYKFLEYFVILFLFLSFIFYFLPSFNGNLVQPAMRVSIPNEYFQMFSWFNTQPVENRVASLPIHSFWGWSYYSWGYQGAGFIQFGIEQPLLDSDYNRWSKYNEQYYREMQYAVYNQDPKILENVLKKYNIRYMILDKSVLNISGFKNETLTWYIPTLLKQSKNIKLIKHFGENLSVYEYVGSPTPKLSSYKNLPDIGPSKTGTNTDKTFNKIGNYLSDKNIETDFDKKFTTYDGRYIGPLDSVIQYTVNSYSKLNELTDCSNKATSYKRSTTSSAIVYESTGGSLCDYFSFPNLSHDRSYIIQIISKNIKGFPLQLYICNSLNFHCNQEFYLTPVKDSYIKEAFIIPRYEDYGQGYTLNINNHAIKNSTSINEIKEISIRSYAHPADSYRQSPGIYLGAENLILNLPWKNTYVLSKELVDNSTLIFSERFDPGWKAYKITTNSSQLTTNIKRVFPFLFGAELKNHVLVNNWANGWEIQGQGESVKGKEIIIVFLPQYLEYAGFILLGGSGLVLGSLGLISYRKRSKGHI